MTNLEKSIIAPLFYYDLLDRPLTVLEIFKYLAAPVQGADFFEIKQILERSDFLKKVVENKQGLYFLKDRRDLMAVREKRLKISQAKWKKLIKISRWLVLVPFLRLAAVTGSLTAYHTRQESDFDLLLVVQNGRLWLARTLTTALLATFRARRHHRLTRDRICLNCYLTSEHLEIKEEAKPRDFHAAQEYGRLTPILEIKPNPYQKFIQTNGWLKNFLGLYPWSASQTANRIKPNKFLGILRQILEWLLSGKIGDGLEKVLGAWQTRRIRQKNETGLADQVYVSEQCLMFHPQSKSYELMKRFNGRMEQLAD